MKSYLIFAASGQVDWPALWEFDVARIIWMEATSERMQKLYRKRCMTNRYFWYLLV